MRSRALATLAISTLLVGSLAPSAAVASGGARFGRIDVGKIDPQVLPALVDPARQVDVMVEMSDQPVAAMVGDARDNGTTVSGADRDARRGQIETHQKPVVDAARQSGGVVVGTLQDAYNGVHLHVRSAALTTLAAIPGVVAIHLVPTYKPALTESVPYIGDPQAWTGTGETGAGVKIAVIDTGAFSPSVSNSQFVPLPAGASAKLPLSVDTRLQTRAPALGWMVVSLDNPNGAPQAALIPVGKLPTGH
ncbi:MAG TPA: hypothetical protein VIK06_05380 [Candidatus Limnocylindrales bacterium]|jgi:minor extracellular serine protease Vpr